MIRAKTCFLAEGVTTDRDTGQISAFRLISEPARRGLPRIGAEGRLFLPVGARRCRPCALSRRVLDNARWPGCHAPSCRRRFRPAPHELLHDLDRRSGDRRARAILSSRWRFPGTERPSGRWLRASSQAHRRLPPLRRTTSTISVPSRSAPATLSVIRWWGEAEGAHRDRAMTGARRAPPSRAFPPGTRARQRRGNTRRCSTGTGCRSPC